MPAKGFKSLTISKKDYRLLRERAERRGVSMARVIGDVLRGLEGSDELRVVETPSAPEVDVVGLEGQIRLLRAEMAGVVDRVNRLEEGLEEEPEEELESEGESYTVENQVPEGLMEGFRFISELKELCERVCAIKVKRCVNARSDRCPVKTGESCIVCALFCKLYAEREALLF